MVFDMTLQGQVKDHAIIPKGREVKRQIKAKMRRITGSCEGPLPRQVGHQVQYISRRHQGSNISCVKRGALAGDPDKKTIHGKLMNNNCLTSLPGAYLPCVGGEKVGLGSGKRTEGTTSGSGDVEVERRTWEVGGRRKASGRTPSEGGKKD